MRLSRENEKLFIALTIGAVVLLCAVVGTFMSLTEIAR